MSQIDERIITPATLPQLFQNSVKSFGNNVMMWEKRGSPNTGARPTTRLNWECAASPPDCWPWG